MNKLRKFDLKYDKIKEDWTLTEQRTKQVRRRYETKAEATAGGELSGALGQEGGSVKIRKKSGEYQEERTFPRSRDPKKSPG